MKFFYLFIIVLLLGCSPQISTTAQKNSENWIPNSSQYSQEVLRGSNTAFRNWWNVLRYDLVLTPNFDKKSIAGTMTMEFEIIKESSNHILQIDLQEPMTLTNIVQLSNFRTENTHQEEFHINKLHWKRDGNAIFINLKELPLYQKGNKILKFYFEGHPKIAKNAPWDGGWVFTTDKRNRPWMSAAVQGLGASSWFPCKDYQGDEPEHGVTFSMIVPEDLVAVANGRLWDTSFVDGEAGSNVYTWEVRNPINVYNIIPYIGYYVLISDQYMGENGPLSLDYWVLDYNVDKAKKHFEQVKPMINAFEDWMGPYPFYEDGFKLVDAPYLGMEHQSGIAYGNQYRNGYLGKDRTQSGFGDKFDFIIIHESAHEWFGNSITTKDIADMWVHEAFTTYAEVMYVENQFGKDAANAYVQGLQPLIKNTSNIIGNYGINSAGSRDMYYKGANIIHTLRQLMEDDVKFKKMIKALNKEFYHQTITTEQIENFISNYTGIDLNEFFNQYLRTPNVPTLVTKNANGQLYYKWTNVIDGFDMPLKLKHSTQWIYPSAEWKIFEGNSEIIADPNFYIFVN